MKPGLDENEPADEHVEVDVLVEGELVREAHLAEEGDAVAEDEEDAEHRVHHQPSTHRTGNHVEWVGCHSVEHGEVLEVVSSLDHDGNVEANDEVEEGKEGEVVPPVAQREVVGQLFPGRNCELPEEMSRNIKMAKIQNLLYHSNPSKVIWPNLSI